MARILAIDFGKKRCGLAATDPEQIIASTLGHRPTGDLMNFLKDYFEREEVETIVLGFPTRSDGSDTDSTAAIREFKLKFEKQFPDKPIVLHDESYSSKMAVEAMVMGGMKKKKRREKGNVDAVAATIILQSYMESQ